MAQDQTPVVPVPVTSTAQATDAEAPQALHLLVGRSLVITSPTRIKRVSLADPAIAEAIVVSPTQVLVNGKVPGGVSLLIWDEADQSQAFEVSVDIDVLGLSQKIHEVFPSEPVRIETSKDMVMLSGHISSAAVADKILEVVKNSTPKVTSLMEVPTAPKAEILLQVKFADVNRSKISQLGFNILSLPGSKNVGTISTQQFAPPQLTNTTSGLGVTNIGLSDLLNIFIFRPDIDFAATIKALQNNNVLEILAEPNLITQSGKDASFPGRWRISVPGIAVQRRRQHHFRDYHRVQGIRYPPELHSHADAGRHHPLESKAGSQLSGFFERLDHSGLFDSRAGHQSRGIGNGFERRTELRNRRAAG